MIKIEELINNIISKITLEEDEKCKRPFENCSVCVDIGICPYDKLLQSKRRKVYNTLKSLLNTSG